MLKKSELEMASKQAENEQMVQERKSLISKHKNDMKQLESVVLELQSEL